MRIQKSVVRCQPVYWDMVRTEEEMNQVKQLLRKWSDLFCQSLRDLPATDLIKYRIPTVKGAKPCIITDGSYSAKEREFLEQALPALIEAGVPINALLLDLVV